MKKGKAITFLSILCALMAAALFLTFARFPIGVKNYNSILGAINYDYDLKGGVAYTYELAKDSEQVEDVSSVLKTVEARLDALGYKSYSVKAVKPLDADGVYDIRIETLATQSIESDIATVMAYGTVKFYGGTSQDPTTEILTEENAISSANYVTGYDLETDSELYQVNIEFTDYGFNTLKGLVSEAESSTSSSGSANKYYLKMNLGDETLLSSEITSSTLTEKTVYVSANSLAKAKQLALQISTGGLQYKYEMGEDSGILVEAPMGKNTVNYILISIGALIVVAMVVLMILYKGYGIFASLGLLCFIMLEIGMMVAVPGINVSMAGLIGIILATILAIDGAVITIKRIREELANKKTVRVAVKNGYKRAFYPVLNTSVISAIVALLGFLFLKGGAWCFAITFGIGVIISFITNVLLTRMFTAVILPLVKNKESFLGEQKKEEIE